MVYSVLFLTNNENAMSLYNWLIKQCDVVAYREPLKLEVLCELNPDLVVSYNYSYIIEEDVIEYMKGNIINLHISYLPWNRGSSPNVWSFIEDTPKGVTIHQINTGLDKGKILYQKECSFNVEKETFSTSYEKLNYEIVELFKEHWEEIRDKKYLLHEQPKGGSYHTMKDLENLKKQISFQWTDNIAEVLKRYKETGRM